MFFTGSLICGRSIRFCSLVISPVIMFSSLVSDRTLSCEPVEPTSIRVESVALRLTCSSAPPDSFSAIGVSPYGYSMAGEMVFLPSG
ncbi:hypothetical protein D3C73_1168990 [compost metagenome]